MAEDLWKATGIRSPTEDQLQTISSVLRLQCTKDELAAYKKYIDDDLLPSYARVEEMVEPSLPVKYPRTPGYRPRPEDNRNNAWYWKCDIAGALHGKLAGKKIGIKDNICVAGVPMMNGCKMLEGFVPEIDATVVTRILDAGGRIVGKTNCENLCFSSSSFTSDAGPTTNPHNPLLTCGGSSSGSAVAVTNGEVDMALGGDQGGSIRTPSSWCGIVGLKPTWGLVPYTGAMPMEITFDHLGPMAKTVKDCALLLEVIAGYDNGNDPRQKLDTAVPEYTKQRSHSGVKPWRGWRGLHASMNHQAVQLECKLLAGDLNGKKIGMVREGFDGCEEDIKACVRRAAESLTKCGAVVEEVSIPLHADGIHIITPLNMDGTYRSMFEGNGTGYHGKGMYIRSIQEAQSKGFKTKPQEFPDAVKMFCLIGEYLKMSHQNKYYAKGKNLTLFLTEAYNNALMKYDVIIMPTLPYKAPKLPTKDTCLSDRLLNVSGVAKNIEPFNCTGHPALTIDVGNREGLPIGMMVIGKHFDETSVFKVAYAYEQLRDGE